MRGRDNHQTLSHPVSRFVGFFLGVATGVIANLLGILFFIFTLPVSIYKGTDSLLSTLVLTPFVLLIMMPFFIVMAPVALLYSIKNGMETGAGKFGGFSAALFFPVAYLEKFWAGIKTAGKVGRSYLFDTQFLSAMMNHLFLPFFASAEVAKMANPEEVDQRFVDGVPRYAHLPPQRPWGEGYSLLNNDDDESKQLPYSSSTVLIFERQDYPASALPPSAPLPQLSYDNINVKLQTLQDMQLAESKLPALDKAKIKTLPSTCQRYVASCCPLSGKRISELKDPLTVEWEEQKVPVTYSQDAFTKHVAQRAKENKPVLQAGKNLNDDDVRFYKGFSSPMIQVLQSSEAQLRGNAAQRRLTQSGGYS